MFIEHLQVPDFMEYEGSGPRNRRCFADLWPQGGTKWLKATGRVGTIPHKWYLQAGRATKLGGISQSIFHFSPGPVGEPGPPGVPGSVGPKGKSGVQDGTQVCAIQDGSQRSRRWHPRQP